MELVCQCVSTRIKRSQNHQSMGSQVLRASSAGTRWKLYMSFYKRIPWRDRWANILILVRPFHGVRDFKYATTA